MGAARETAGPVHAPSPDRLFDPEPSRRSAARELYAEVKDLPLVCPHGHVPPALLSDPDATLGTPADLFIIPDHYVYRMLYSRGVPMEGLGVPTRDGTPVETDHRRVWQRFCENFHLFRATPTGLWLRDELANVFGMTEKPSAGNARRLYDELEEKLSRPEFSPRALFRRFGVETLCTTDAAGDALEHHRSLREEGWGDTVRPTFRPDGVTDLAHPDWMDNIERLSETSGVGVTDYGSFARALEDRRAFFKEMGALATDHSALYPLVRRLPKNEAEEIFARALRGEATEEDAGSFTAHMLHEMARMSTEDGLVMQMHIGSFRDHDEDVHQRFGPDSGADIPVRADWTRGLGELLNDFGSNPRFRLVVFTLDEGAYARELAPLAGHYPAMLLGAPWWFYDSPLGMRRYLDAVIETAGLQNTAGFNDDTRAFASIPSRHDVWRRVTCDWLAEKLITGVIDEEDAGEMAHDFAYGLARRAYNLEGEPVRSTR
ncbi:glucuronate isomerase [Rubrobacter tropicus]|uniref:Uronate isomerase n=1 Tax=Rubrobacter tropicus TaxID=2653851 RepID=A0A6G8Q4Z3_9ACTN|nr:glucuronate isomerase [Rubrobacter tropicus]QIN81545.1 glucuronate isomerase [Rubrobacter tropicus]